VILIIAKPDVLNRLGAKILFIVCGENKNKVPLFVASRLFSLWIMPCKGAYYGI
jgi:hypothetical protein